MNAELDGLTGAQKMRRDNYIVIRNFIEEDKVHQMCEDYKKFCVDNNLKGDWLVEKCYSYHNYLPYLELLMHKSGYFSELILYICLL